MSDDLWQLVDSGDVSAVMRHLRTASDDLPLTDLARAVGWAAGRMGFEDLVRASSDLARHPKRPQVLYDFGYACVEHGASYAAIPALREALRRSPADPGIRSELVAALEREERHSAAVAVLREHETDLEVWPGRYLLAYNAILAGDGELADRVHAQLPEPSDPDWAFAYERLSRIIARWRTARGTASLDGSDLRGWQFVLTGSVLGTISPYGFDAGMTGRWAYHTDSADLIVQGLRRLRLVLETARVTPASVSPLPDRSSEILGRAAGLVLGLPALPFDATRRDTLVVAYDLNEVPAPEDLYDRVPGQILYEHAGCWTDPPRVSPDVVTLLRQTGPAPWGPRLKQQEDGSIGETPPDERPVAEIAEEIAAATGASDEGDGATPPDPDDAFVEFVRGVSAEWSWGPRYRVPSPGPVPSNRFL